MRFPALAGAALIAVVAVQPVMAEPIGGISSINVVVGPKLQDKAREYGVREFDALTSELIQSVERALRKQGGGLVKDGGRLDLIIEDARPSRPTAQQLAAKPGLSMESRGVGGATVSGALTTADGRRIPLRYKWYESDIRAADGTDVWSHAETSFDNFANRLVRGELPAKKR